MVLIKRIHNRGANIVVEANAEVLFLATGDVGKWSNIFRKRIEIFTAGFAPSNSRPRWAHYGRPLGKTFTSDISYQPGRLRVYAAAGSTSNYAAFVDQGTGVYVGNAPYEAKILPPWERGSASLYEHTWRPAGPGTPEVKPVMIKGQRGQFFFARGLERAFQSMRMRSFQLPGDARIAKALSVVPASLGNFVGATPGDAAFEFSLIEWRVWRDVAWRRDEHLGKDWAPGRTRQQVAREEAAKQTRNRTRKANYDSQTQALKRQREDDEIKVRAKSIAKKKGEEKEARDAAEKRAKDEQTREFNRILKQKKATNAGGSLKKVVLQDANGRVIGYAVIYTAPDGEVTRRDFRV